MTDDIEERTEDIEEIIEEIEEQQADVAGLLLDHVYAPLVGERHVRGVLPVPPAAGAVRVVVGGRGEADPGRLTAYEVALRSGDELLTPHDVVGVLRAVHAGTRSHGYERVGMVMGMPLIRVDPAAVEAGPFTVDDWARTLLRCLAQPSAEERPAVRLRGFLFRGRDRLRLYLDGADVPGVTAADVQPGGALTALLAVLPSMLDEEWRTSADAGDPHCARVVDLTDY
ncbi:hypothetical protein [Streptomyces olivaceiscleroticus]|uniref:Uncharacterized protein n=1 Tax=Streptomyces olivaceiscleroticus TaxID=68245 RepID=A0ABP3JK73_9ACTN